MSTWIGLLFLGCAEAPACGPGEGLHASGDCVSLEVSSEDVGLEDEGDAEADDPGGSDDSGAAGGDDTAADTADTTGPSGPTDNPWAGTTDVATHEEMACERYEHPCNHKVMFALGSGDSWAISDFELALHASVPDPVLIPRERDGEDWLELRIYYQDAYEGNVTVKGDETIISFASLAFPRDALTSASAADLFAGEAGYAWVYRGTDATLLDDNVVDPGIEVIEDGEGGLAFYLTLLNSSEGTQEDPDHGGDEYPDPQTLFLATSKDGVSFERSSQLFYMTWEDGIGTDPDPFPLGFDGPYPGVLPSSYLVGGTSGWAVHLSQGEGLHRWEGDLVDGLTDLGNVVQERTTVSTTSLFDGHMWIYGHYTEDAHVRSSPALIRVHEYDGYTYSGPEVALSFEADELVERGLYSPSRVPLGLDDGVDLLVFTTTITALSGEKNPI